MKLLRRLPALFSLAFALVCFHASAQDDAYAVFVPISKYVEKGDAEKLSAWFADNLEVTIDENTVDSSRKQARQIMKLFFENHTPSSFSIGHRASHANVKYAIGQLSAGGEKYILTVFVSCQGDSYQIQQIKIVKDR